MSLRFILLKQKVAENGKRGTFFLVMLLSPKFSCLLEPFGAQSCLSFFWNDEFGQCIKTAIPIAGSNFESQWLTYSSTVSSYQVDTVDTFYSLEVQGPLRL